jgi:hypothetical protein
MITYVKMGGIALAIALIFCSGLYVGNLRGDVKTDTCKAAAAVDTAAQDTTITTGLEKQIAHSQAEQINDNAAEAIHAKDIQKIDTTPAVRTDPVIVRRGPAQVCVAAMPGAKAPTGPVGTGAAAGGSSPSGGDGDNRRPEIEELKQRLERIAADERLLIAKWQK